MAAEAARRLNADLRVTPLTRPLDSTTEHIFGDEFFSRVDGVAAALDSFQARECSAVELGPLSQAMPAPLLTPPPPLPGRYVAARCTRYLKPLLEAGTQGTRGSAAVFVPHVTEEYRAPASTSSEEAPYPVCTVRYSPSTVEHTLQVRSAPETPIPPAPRLSAQLWTDLFPA